jgi:hypothetical protein
MVVVLLFRFFFSCPLSSWMRLLHPCGLAHSFPSSHVLHYASQSSPPYTQLFFFLGGGGEGDARGAVSATSHLGRSCICILSMCLSRSLISPVGFFFPFGLSGSNVVHHSVNPAVHSSLFSQCFHMCLFSFRDSACM